jgi:hypothetical protein
MRMQTVRQVKLTLVSVVLLLGTTLVGGLVGSLLWVHDD